nr:F0F1 ATP synthase subunit A [uncultured Agathobaculum sp.]
MRTAINGPRILGWLFDNPDLPITETMRNAWIVMAFIFLLCLFLTWRMDKLPRGRQALAEKLVLTVDALVERTMGAGCRAYAPYIATLMASSVLGSLASLFWMRPVTADLNTTLGWALITFALITWNKLRCRGVKGYLKGFLEPVPVMAPLNVLSEAATPVSMSFRHFGNMAGGLVISTLILSALEALSGALLGFLPVPLLQIGLPGVLSLYFDCFTACMQAFIFCMLTMSYIGDARHG